MGKLHQKREGWGGGRGRTVIVGPFVVAAASALGAWPARVGGSGVPGARGAPARPRRWRRGDGGHGGVLPAGSWCAIWRSLDTSREWWKNARREIGADLEVAPGGPGGGVIGGHGWSPRSTATTRRTACKWLHWTERAGQEHDQLPSQLARYMCPSPLTVAATRWRLTSVTTTRPSSKYLRPLAAAFSLTRPPPAVACHRWRVA